VPQQDSTGIRAFPVSTLTARLFELLGVEQSTVQLAARSVLSIAGHGGLHMLCNVQVRPTYSTFADIGLVYTDMLQNKVGLLAVLSVCHIVS
jgi:hypothetical protein